MYPIFKVFIPVFSFSFISKSDIYFFASLLKSLYSSNSLETPLFITFPSFNNIGVSGFIEFSILFIISVAIFVSVLFLKDVAFSSFCKILFIVINESFKANISLGCAPPLTILDTILSKSQTDFKSCLNSSFNDEFSTNTFVLFCLFVISETFNNGFINQFLNNLAPIGVIVESIASSKDPSCFNVDKDLNISKFFIATESKTIKSLFSMYFIFCNMEIVCG